MNLNPANKGNQEIAEGLLHKASSAGNQTRTFRHTQGSTFTQGGIITLKPPSPTPPMEEIVPIPQRIKEEHHATIGDTTSTARQQSSINELKARYDPVFSKLKQAGLLTVAGLQMSKDLSIAEVTGSGNSDYMRTTNIMYETKTDSLGKSIQESEKQELFEDMELTEAERQLRYEDPELFVHLMILKKTKRNPDANVTQKIKREVIFANEKPRGDGKVHATMKQLKYSKIDRT